MAQVLHEKHSRVVPSTSFSKTSTSLSSDNNKVATVEDFPQHAKDEGTHTICRSLSLLSRSSLRLLSQCSSLDSLPSLGLSFHGSASAQYLLKGDLSVEAEHYCALTLKRQGEQVLCGENGVLYSASSCSQGSMRVFSNLELPVDNNKLTSSRSTSDGGSVVKEGPVRAMTVMGEWLFSSHADFKIRVWTRAADKDQTTTSETAHKMVAAIPTLWDCVTRALVPGAYVEVRRHQRKSLWIQHVDIISALAVNRSGCLLYSASWDRSVKVWRLPDFKCMESFKAHDDAVNALAVSDDGSFLYTGSADSKIKVWTKLHMEKKTKTTMKQKQKHVLVCTLTAHRSAVNALALSPDASLLYSGACDKAIVVWERGAADAHHGMLAGALRGHRQAVLCLVAMTTTLCSGSADKTIRVWHRVTGRIHTCVAILEGHSAPVKSLSTSYCDHEARCSSVASSSLYPYTSSARFLLYSASLDHDLKRWSIKLTLSEAPNSSDDAD